MSGNHRLFTLSVLFVAVLFAYQQRNASVKTETASKVKGVPEPSANRYYPGETSRRSSSSRFAEDIRRSTEPFFSFDDSNYAREYHTGNGYPRESTHAPHTPIGRRLPKEVFKFLHRIPFIVFPFIYRMVLSVFRAISVVVQFLLPLIIRPLHLLFEALSTVLQPIITLLQGIYLYLVLTPLGVAMYIGGLFYPFYVLGAVAVLVGGFLGACGGMFHGGIIAPWTGDKRKEVKEEVHREMEGFAEGRGRGRERASIKSSKLSKGKERDLRGWRDDAW
ncbi:hypothetical protein CPB86DRAFT_874165 [Serendipita vermifera]|nr:hypothetical protein CPB86DRAFT_874165 [Serendipita vermifera]